MILHLLDVITKKMLIGTVTLLVIIRALAIASPFVMRKADKKNIKAICVLPVLLVVPSFYFITVSFEDYQNCPVSYSYAKPWNRLIHETRNAIVRIAIDVFIKFVIVTASLFCITFLLNNGVKSKRKVKASANIALFLLLLVTFFFPETAFDMVKQCVRLEQLAGKQNDFHEVGLTFEVFDSESLSFGRNEFGNATRPFDGFHCWFMRKEKQQDAFFMDHLDMDRRVFIDSFYATKFLEVIGSYLLGIFLIVSSSTYIDIIKGLIPSLLKCGGCVKKR